MEIKDIKRDSSRARIGEWVGDIPGLEDVRLKVRGISAPSVLALKSKKERKVGRKDRESDGNIKPDVAVRILGEVLCEAVLLDWDGFTDKGKPIPYSEELAREWLTNPDFIGFADAVVWAAGIVDRGLSDAQEDMEGNSSRRSRGKSTTDESTAQPSAE